MSAILSADDLNDFISPGVACIKPIETLPAGSEDDSSNPYEVTTEDKVAAANPQAAQISLTDCLACSGCVTSAEAMLVSLQSHMEVLNVLDSHPEFPLPPAPAHAYTGSDGKLFVASVSPQSRASLAAAFGVTEREAGHMIERLLSGAEGVRSGGAHGSGFTWLIDTNTVREAVLVLAADELVSSLSPHPSAGPKRPILTSACPGWICYAEKTHPHVLPHLSRMKSPQALAGTLVKSVLCRKYGIPPDKVWHLAVMPCFDKKLEASRSELTSAAWLPSSSLSSPSRDVDCVITARELISLAQNRGIDFAAISRRPLPRLRPFPDPELDAFLFPTRQGSSSIRPMNKQDGDDPTAVGTSGGYLHHIMQALAAPHPPGSTTLHVERGRNADVVEYSLRNQKGDVLVRTARLYGFRNIQNLVRRLRPAKASRMPGARAVGPKKGAGPASSGRDGPGEYAYVEVMACPGGCTNGGGQVKAGDLVEASGLADVVPRKPGPQQQKEWLSSVDEAYFSASSTSSESGSEPEVEKLPDVHVSRRTMEPLDGDVINGVSTRRIHDFLRHWSEITGVAVQTLTQTSYRKVESDVGKAKKSSDVERVAGLASSIGGGW